MNATPIIIGSILVFILAYRYYYGFVMARLAIFKSDMITPATRMYDGSNYYPMSKWDIILQRLLAQVLWWGRF
jgi:carbon starvation protein CstA